MRFTGLGPDGSAMGRDRDGVVGVDNHASADIDVLFGRWTALDHGVRGCADRWIQ